jgi:hypothetical protein
MSASRERLARNQALYREVNERIQDLAEGEDKIEFVCECSNTDCMEFMALTNSEYERVRSDPTWFVIKTDHHIPEIERVISQGAGYAVVEKFVAEDYLEEADPRSNGSEGGPAGA